MNPKAMLALRSVVATVAPLVTRLAYDASLPSAAAAAIEAAQTAIKSSEAAINAWRSLPPHFTRGAVVAKEKT
jgi:hypothetical protein